MKNKYYTPTKEEFYIGFEFEIIRHNKWNILTMSSGGQLDMEIIETLIEDSSGIRVKYLDKDDIEDLGFDEIVDLYELKTNYDIIRLQHHNNRLITLWYYDKINEEFRTLVQQIEIKNKSEFKKLLKQLNIL